MINYASRKRLEPYWVNTSENKMIRDAMDQCGEGFRKEYEELISQGRVTSFVQIETSFYEYQSSESLWGLLINAGMVTVEEIVDMDLYTLRIPNQEVGRAFRGLTAHHLHVSEGDYFKIKKWKISECHYGVQIYKRRKGRPASSGKRGGPAGEGKDI